MQDTPGGPASWTLRLPVWEMGRSDGREEWGVLSPPAPPPASDSTGSLKVSQGRIRSVEVAEAGGAGCSGSGWPGLTHRPCERLMAWWPEEGRGTEGRRAGRPGPGGRWAAQEAHSLGCSGGSRGASGERWDPRPGALGRRGGRACEEKPPGGKNREARTTEAQGGSRTVLWGRGPSPGTGMQPVLRGTASGPRHRPGGGSCGADPSGHRPAQGSRALLGGRVCRPLASNLGIPGHSWGPRRTRGPPCDPGGRLETLSVERAEAPL